MHELDQQYSTFDKPKDSNETLDAKFASEHLQLKINHIEGEIAQFEEAQVVEFTAETRQKKKWCLQVLFKLKEAMMKLMAILGQYQKAVRLALNTGMLVEA